MSEQLDGGFHQLNRQRFARAALAGVDVAAALGPRKDPRALPHVPTVAPGRRKASTEGGLGSHASSGATTARLHPSAACGDDLGPRIGWTSHGYWRQ